MEELRELRNQARVDGGSDKKMNEKEEGHPFRRGKEEPRGRRFQ